MSGESVAQDQLRAFVERVERLNDEKAAINADISEIYKEMKGNGFDTKVVKKIVADRAKDANERMEFDALYELYAAALGMIATPDFDEPRVQVQARVREATESAIQKHDAETGEITKPQSAPQAARDLANPPSPQGRVALPSQAKASTDGGTTAQDIEMPADSVTGEASRASDGAGSVAPIQPETANELPPAPRGTAGEDDLRELAATVPDQIAQEGDAPLEASTNVTGEGMSGHAAHLSTDFAEPDATPAGAVVANRSGVTGGESAAVMQGASVREEFPPVPMKRLPYADCFPAVLGAAYQRLGDDIATNGVQRPIVRMGDVIVDGWARYNICRALSVEYPVTQYRGNDVLMDVIAWQRRDREFTPAQEKQIAAKLVKAVPHRAADILAAFDLAEEMEAAE